MEDNSMVDLEAIVARQVEKQQLSLGSYQHAYGARLKAWSGEEIGRRLWQKDGTVWVVDPAEAASAGDLTDRLGWLTLPAVMPNELENLQAFSREMRNAGFSQVVLLGMGGSSLAPEVFMRTFGNRPGYPPVTVLDSTHPVSIQRVLQSIDVAKTLFIVSSKSGGTIETLSFYKFFFEAVKDKRDDPGLNFVAITDPGSALEKLAGEKNFRRVFSAPPEVGGRYSALTYFGMVPAALIGVDVKTILERASIMAHACSSGVPADKNPGLMLGAAMGELALAGRDKITFLASPGISSFGAWVEQLIAESTGKKGTGILPVVDTKPGPPDAYSRDRFFIYLRLAGDENDTLDQMVNSLEKKGHPVVRIHLDEKPDMGAEFFRWEMATAAAGAVLGINPFDQPDVEAAKIKARELMDAYRKNGVLPSDEPVLTDQAMQLYGGTGSGSSTAAGHLADFLKQKREGDFVAIMAYISSSPQSDELLDEMRIFLRDRLHIATTVGYGPRFLHSTGQLHKGGRNNGLFIQITHTPESDCAIPGEPYSFGTLIAAQALGDYQALQERKRRLIRFHLGSDLVAGLERLRDIIEGEV